MKIKEVIKHAKKHIIDFPYIWVFFLFIIAASLFAYGGMWSIAKFVGTVAVLIIVILLWGKPMNAVYGLMGTSGSIRLFFFNFIVITLIFACVYHWAFFKYAGISYDVNQPHINFQMYADQTQTDEIKNEELAIRESLKRDTFFVEHKLDSTSYTETIINTYITRDTITPPFLLHYQPIGFLQVWRSTILTTLTQESTDLLNIATVHNEAMESTNVGLDEEKSELFEWILIFHIIISWIFFGVFISLLYNKFRYES